MGDDRKDLQRQGIGEWASSGDFFGSILAGLLLGLLADGLLGTRPWLVVIGIIAGFGVGFWRMVAYSDRILDEVARRGRPRPTGSEHDDPADSDD